MGRHSRPDPEEFAGEPSQRGYPGYSDGGDDAGENPDPGHQDVGPDRVGDQAADYEPRYADYRGAGHPDALPGSGADEYPEFSVGPRQPPTPPAGGGHRGGSESRGGHRSARGRRGVSIGVIAALVAVVVVVSGFFLWRFFGHVLADRSHTAAGRCLGAKVTVAVVADPSVAGYVQEFADRYNGSGSRVGDHCVVVSVKPAGSDAVVHGFVGSWPAELGDRPALWVPASSVSKARLVAALGQRTISDSRSLVTSPVLIALRPELQRALGNQNWTALPGLQSKPDALAGLNLPAWGSLRLALPLGGNSDAAYLAAEAVAAASAGGAPPTAGAGAVRMLIDAQPKLVDNSLTEAMNVLLAPGDPATAPVHAVVTTEQQLFQRGRSLRDASRALTSWLPPGPAAVADYPTVLLSGSWLSPDQATAASEFARFMHKPDQLAALAKAGFRVPGVKPPSSDVTSFAAVSSTLSVGDDTMRATLADALIAPPIGPVATIMLDQTMSTSEAGKTRLANVVAALGGRIQALPANSVMGLWTFDGTEGRSEVPIGPLPDDVNGQPRSAALNGALDRQRPSEGGSVSFTTLRLVYQDALANFRPGQANSVLVITAGPHTDKTLDGPGLQDFIRQSVDPAKPIAVNIVDFGADPDRATWEAVAQLSGGSYQNLATSDSPELATVINNFLS